MTSTQTPSPFIARITNYLPLIEKVLLAALAVGVVLAVTKIDVTVARISLLGLAVTFFLYAYKPVYVPDQENEKFSFAGLLGLTIVPKVLWLSSAISATGISLYLFGIEGYKQMLTIGALTIASATLVLAFFVITNVKHINLVTPVLFRAFPLFLADIYLLLNG
jgi:hypothetical protein